MHPQNTLFLDIGNIGGHPAWLVHIVCSHWLDPTESKVKHVL
jgi:hypothetical protein